MHVLGCLVLIAAHEMLISCFSHNIFENGWIDTPDMEEIFSRTPIEEDLEYYGLMFVPVINVICILDVIYKITHKNEGQLDE